MRYCPTTSGRPRREELEGVMGVSPVNMGIPNGQLRGYDTVKKVLPKNFNPSRTGHCKSRVRSKKSSRVLLKTLILFYYLKYLLISIREKKIISSYYVGFDSSYYNLLTILDFMCSTVLYN